MSIQRADRHRIFTIGHSTRALDEFLDILRAHHIGAIADVRRFPASRRLPWFNAAELSRALSNEGIEYWPFPALGGRRKPVANSPNAGWRNASFRGYADYMQTREFAESLNALIARATSTSAALMCAEAVPWRCHRSLIADALLVRGWEVLDIFDGSKATPHQLTPFAKVDGSKILYPPVEDAPGNLFRDGRKSGPTPLT